MKCIAVLVLLVASTHAANVCGAVFETRGFGNGPMTLLCTSIGGTVAGILSTPNGFGNVWYACMIPRVFFSLSKTEPNFG